jgi:PAS domain S-box-containing protein
MASSPGSAFPADRRAADTIRDAAEFEAAVAAALNEIATRLGAPRVGLILGDDSLSREFWHPAGIAIPEAEHRALLDHAAWTLAGEAGERPPGRVAARVLAAAGQGRGVVVWSEPARRRPAEGRDPATAGALNGLFDLLALRLAHRQELRRGETLHAQYERWFRTMDDQLRVLDRERQKFAAIVHRFDAGVFVTDTARRIRWTNSVMGAHAPPGPEGSSWIGQGCRVVCAGYGASAGDAECRDCPVALALEHNEVAHREYRFGDAGDTRNHYLSALPIKGPDGRAHEVMVMIQDLSDLEIVRKSESRYRLLFDSSAKAILMVDPATRKILLANPAASRMTGYSRDTLTKLRLEDLHHPDEWGRLAADYATAFGAGTLAPRPCRVMTLDGDFREAVVSGTRYDMGLQEVVMIDFEDVTESRRVRDALVEAEARLRTVVSNSPIVLFSIDRNGIFTLSEGRGLEALGLQPGQVVGQSAWDIYRDQPGILKAIQRALAGEAFSESVPLGALHFETHYTPTRDEKGEVTGLIGVATDISERRSLESQLRHAQRMEAIGRLAGGVAHDFNNLLAAILGHGELMMSELPPAHPLRRNAEEIQKAGVRGALLTRQLLAFSRKEVLAPSVLDLNAVMMALDELLFRLIGEDIDLATIPAMRPVLVRADRGQIEQIIMNLAINARDAMPQGGRLNIEIDVADLDQAYARQHPRVRPGRYAVIAVTDSGMGMDSETLAHAFEPFYTTKEQGKGTGLGLATVYGIAEASRGHVWVYSEPGVGTTFKVYLPEAQGTLLEPAEAPGPAGNTRGTETLLLVEDEDTVRSLGREVLEGSGYHVLEAVDGVDALRVAESWDGPIHMLVTDVVMPRMGGGELAGKLVALRPGVRVLYVSGYTNDSVVRHGVRDRSSAFLQKPFSLDAFARKVREVLDAPYIEPGLKTSAGSS